MLKLLRICRLWSFARRPGPRPRPRPAAVSMASTAAEEDEEEPSRFRSDLVGVSAATSFAYALRERVGDHCEGRKMGEEMSPL